MTRKELKKIISNYKSAQQQITELEEKYGIRIGNLTDGFDDLKEDIIYSLIKEIFGDKNNLFWDYILEENKLSFEDLCIELDIKDTKSDKMAIFEEYIDQKITFSDLCKNLGVVEDSSIPSIGEVFKYLDDGRLDEYISDTKKDLKEQFGSDIPTSVIIKYIQERVF